MQKTVVLDVVGLSRFGLGKIADLEEDRQHHIAGPGNGLGQSAVIVQSVLGFGEFVQKTGGGRVTLDGKSAGEIVPQLLHQLQAFPDFRFGKDDIQADDGGTLFLEFVHHAGHQGSRPGPPAQLGDGIVINIHQHDVGLGVLSVGPKFSCASHKWTVPGIPGNRLA